MHIQNQYRLAIILALGITGSTSLLADEAGVGAAAGKGKSGAAGEYNSKDRSGHAQHGDKATKFIHEALMGNQMEVQMGQLGLQLGQNPQVKALAQALVTDHGAALTSLQTIATQKGIKTPSADKSLSGDTDSATRRGIATSARTPGQDASTTTASGRTDATPTAQGGPAGHEGGQEHQKHTAMLEELKSKTGAEFDKAFVRMGLKDHKKDISKYEKASTEVTDSAVKSYIDQTLPTLRKHMELTQAAAKAVGLTDTDLTSIESEIRSESRDGVGAPAAGVQGANSESPEQNRDGAKNLNSGAAPKDGQSNEANPNRSKPNKPSDNTTQPDSNNTLRPQPETATPQK